MYGFDEGSIIQDISEIKKKLAILLENGAINNMQSRQIIGRITATSSLNQVLDGATFIIEAMSEDAQLKNSLFIDLDKKCRPEVRNNTGCYVNLWCGIFEYFLNQSCQSL